MIRSQSKIAAHALVLMAACLLAGAGDLLARNRRPAETRLRVPEAELLDEEGRPVRLHADLARNRVLVLSFVFTSCTTMCGPFGANVGALQSELGQSLSIDPANDAPARMKEWGAQFHAGKSWRLLTGKRSAVDAVLKQLKFLLRRHSESFAVSAARGRPERQMDACERA